MSLGDAAVFVRRHANNEVFAGTLSNGDGAGFDSPGYDDASNSAEAAAGDSRTRPTDQTG